MPTQDWGAPTDLTVKIDGKDLPSLAYRDLLEVTVQEDLEAPSMFTLRLASWNEEKRIISWADDKIFAVGGEVEVSLGYVGAIASLMKGEITGLELEMAAGEVPALVVRGYDRRHRLLRGTKTRSFVKMRDSDIAAQIARENGLRAKVTSSEVKHDYVLQRAQPDLVFLNRRAEAIGYEVVVEDRTLLFRPPQNAERPAIILSLEDSLIEFSPRLTVRGQASAVQVRGWDPREKKAFVGQARSTRDTAMGFTLGAKMAEKAFGEAVVTHVDSAVTTQADADKMAMGVLQTMGLGFIQGEGTSFGRTDLRAGLVATVKGAGERFSGKYYVTSATHTYASERGYRTAFTVRRNAT